MRRGCIILYVIMVAVSWFGFGTEWGYTASSPWWTHLTYHFQHGNIFHLAANMVAIFIMALSRRDPLWVWLASYALATACSFAVSSPLPTVGMSGMIMAYYGIVMAMGGGWRSVLYTAVLTAVFGVFTIRMAAWLHMACLASGIIAGCLVAEVRMLTKEDNIYGRK